MTEPQICSYALTRVSIALRSASKLVCLATATTTWVERVRAGEVRALSRAISAIEDNAAEALELLKALFPYSGGARAIGLTGAAGMGKSTPGEQQGRQYRKKEKTVGLIPDDPSSRYTGWATPGDSSPRPAHPAGT